MTVAIAPHSTTTLTAAQVVERLGGVCSWRELRRALHWRQIAAALKDGAIVRLGRGLYGLADAADARTVARRMTGVVSHRTAALHWGWKVKSTPDLPDVTVPRNRKLRRSARDLATVHWRAHAPEDVAEGWVTTQVRTVIDCCLDLPFDEALAVFDSALRARVRLRDVIKAMDGLGKIQHRRVERVARAASAKAANPFESVLRALSIEAGGCFEAQHRVRYDDFYARVDLGDGALEIVIEAESFESHGDKASLRRDCRRYTELGARGWLVLRFTWDQVMFEQDWVRRMIGKAVRRRRAELAHVPEGGQPEVRLQGRPTGQRTGQLRVVPVR